MRNESPSRLTRVGLACCAVLVCALAVGSQQRVQTTTQLTVATPVAASPLQEWNERYAEAMKVAEEFIASGYADDGRRLEKDLEALDQAVREYIRVSERLRHKNRALTETAQFLASQHTGQMESRQFQTLSNASKAAHDVESATVRNAKD